jgi:hypothetical protein
MILLVLMHSSTTIMSFSYTLLVVLENVNTINRKRNRDTR